MAAANSSLYVVAEPCRAPWQKIGVKDVPKSVRHPWCRASIARLASPMLGGLCVPVVVVGECRGLRAARRGGFVPLRFIGTPLIGLQ